MIFVLVDGKIVEQGTYDYLYADREVDSRRWSTSNHLDRELNTVEVCSGSEATLAMGDC